MSARIKRATTMKTKRPFKRRATTVTTKTAILGRTGLQEVKSFDCNILGGNLPLTAAAAGAEPGAVFAGITELNCIPQGPTVANRIGNKIVIKSIHFKGTVTNSNLALLSGFRLALIYDKQPNGAFPALTDLLLDQPAGTATYYSGINIANKSCFEVIRDKFYNLDAAQANMHIINWYCKGRWETEYGGNAGTIADFRTGALYLVGLYTSTIAILSISNCRIRYFD